MKMEDSLANRRSSFFCVIMVITSVVSGDDSNTKEDKYMSSYKYKHLTLDDRITIQKALKEGQTFVEIGALLGKDPSTVSKEVKAHLDYRNTGTRSRGYNPCRHRKRCTKQYISVAKTVVDLLIDYGTEKRTVLSVLCAWPIVLILKRKNVQV